MTSGRSSFPPRRPVAGRIEWDTATAQESHDGNRARVSLWRPADNVVATKMSGHLELNDVKWYMARVDRIISNGTSLYIFHNLQSITGYDSDVRPYMTDWAAKRKSFLCGTHMLVGSPVLAMSISVASLVLGRELRPYDSVERFDEALAEVLASQF